MMGKHIKMDIWAESSLNEYLNTTYFSTIKDTSNVVMNPVWNVGVADEDMIITSQESYQGTSSNPRPVALVNVEEVRKAGGADGWIVEQEGGSSHWTITASTKGNGTVYRFNKQGNMTNSNTTSSSDVEPVIYLKNTINLSGDGTIENPYTIT